MTKIFGSISKIIDTKSNSFEFIMTDNNDNKYKIVDSYRKYDLLFTEDHINVVLSKINDTPNWKIEQLCEFNRPFNAKQLYLYLSNLYKSKTTFIDKLCSNLNWSRLSELMQLQKYDKQLIMDELQKSKFDQKIINRLNRF